MYAKGGNCMNDYNADEDYEYVINRYNVPVKTGQRVRYTGHNPVKEGTIVKACGQYLGIKLDGDKYIGRYHPTWALDYLDENGDVIVSYKS
jgi:hypothetical protein